MESGIETIVEDVVKVQFVQPEDCMPTLEGLVQLLRRREGSWEPGKCDLCGRTIGKGQRVCERAARMVDKAEQIAARVGSIERRMPRLYREIKEGASGGVDWEAHGRVIHWDMCPRGLTLYGESGSGKTTAIWHLARRLVSDNHPVMVFTAGDFSEGYFRALQQRRVDEWVRDLRAVAVLMIDDLGKEIDGEGVVNALFRVINGRVEDRKPVIVTTRYTGAQLKERMSKTDPCVGEDIARRLRDYTETVQFRKRA